MTIPKRIRDERQLLPGTAVELSVNRDGEVVLHLGVKHQAHRSPTSE